MNALVYLFLKSFLFNQIMTKKKSLMFGKNCNYYNFLIEVGQSKTLIFKTS